MDVLERRHLAPVAAIRNGRRLSIRICTDTEVGLGGAQLVLPSPV